MFRYSPTFEIVVFSQKEHKMTTKELRRLRDELKQLSVELIEFKGELLAGRVREMEQMVCGRVNDTSQRMRRIAARINQDIN